MMKIPEQNNIKLEKFKCPSRQSDEKKILKSGSAFIEKVK